jgi:hypothetical protein
MRTFVLTGAIDRCSGRRDDYNNYRFGLSRFISASKATGTINQGHSIVEGNDKINHRGGRGSQRVYKYVVVNSILPV